MRSKLASFCIVRPLPSQRLGVMVLTLLLANGVVLLDARQAVCAAEKEASAQESEPSAEDAEPSAEDSEPSAEEAEPSAEKVEPSAEQSKGDKSEDEISESPKKKSSSKKSPQSSEKVESDQQKKSDEKSTVSDEEKAKQELENNAAKAAEAAGAEVEVVDDSEEIEPEETVEETPPVVVETEKQPPKVDKRVIGATATIMEKKSELLFRARVDSGAKSCSLHIEDMKIENESDNMADNIGKVVRFHIKNGHKESHWLEAKIAGYVIIKTSNEADDRKRRYKVPLTFRYKDFEKTVLVTLNNREHMEFPLLLGRNFLKNDFVVDVSLESSD